MTSKPSSMDALTEILKDLLTTRAHNDALGAITLNVTDGLFAIASAINHLAEVQERTADRQARSIETMIIDSLRTDGHA